MHFRISTDLFSFRVEFPNDAVHTLESNQHLHVEQDGVVKTQ